MGQRLVDGMLLRLWTQDILVRRAMNANFFDEVDDTSLQLYAIYLHKCLGEPVACFHEIDQWVR
jgi:hypothetical protein